MSYRLFDVWFYFALPIAAVMLIIQVSATRALRRRGWTIKKSGD